MRRRLTDGRRREIEAQLELPDFPLPLLYLWNTFNRIRRRCGGNGFGASPIGWSDIDAFVRLSGVRLVPWEVQTIERLDDLYLLSRSSAKVVEEP